MSEPSGLARSPWADRLAGEEDPSEATVRLPRARDVRNSSRYDATACVRCGGPRERRRGPICDHCSPGRTA